MGRKPIANAEKKIFREIVTLAKSSTVNKISTLDIASRMHLSETIIYSRFPTKKSLMKAAFNYCIAELGDFSPFRFIVEKLSDSDSFNEFKRLSYSVKEHENEAKYIMGYIQSDYFEFSDLEDIDALDVKKTEGAMDSIPQNEIELSIKAYLIALIYTSLIVDIDSASLKRAYALLPNIKL